MGGVNPNTGFRDGYQSQGAPLGGLSKSLTLTADNTAIAMDAFSVLLLGSDSTTASQRTFTVGPSALIGQKITIIFTTGSSTTAQLATGATMKLTATWEPVQYDSLALISDGTMWVEEGRGLTVPADVSLADGLILVGNVSNVGAPVALSGDATIDNLGEMTIAAGAIDNAKVDAAAAIAYSKLATLTSGNILVGSAGNVATSVAMSGDATIIASGAVTVGAGKITQAMLTAPSVAGLQAKRIAYSVFDPSAVVGDRTVAGHALASTIPDNAFVTGVWYWVETTFTSAGVDTGTIALSIQAADDCVVAIAIDDGTNPWDTTAKPVECIPVLETTSTWLATTAARAVTATVGGQALTAGKMHIWAEYVVYV